MAIECGHCKAGRPYLRPLIEDLAGGIRLQTVRCVRCGWQKERLVAPPRVDNPDRPQSEKPSSNCGRRPTGHACNIEGCEKGYVPAPGRAPYCLKHRQRLEKWLRSSMRTPPPYIRDDGRVYENPARQFTRGPRRQACG
ncbi:hypothetical protein [Geoalkalibacter sp.]|uniref:hypothetical protein n=1 Tax=Geoalkalibacter sp. TaxID=3041440 RepID=UPI00272EB60F|nr:hypothetical protein [Geoalkalibacter sp.]